MSFDANGSPQLSAGAVSALHRGDKIEAIRITREERRIGLKESKDAVDEYIRTQPALQASLAARQADATRSILFWLGVVVAAVAIGYYMLKR
jgi:ribosomal protein L7/L12